MEKNWEKICSNLQKTLKPGDFKVWITPLQGRVENNTVFIVAASSYVSTWIQKCFSEEVRKASAQALQIQPKDVELIFTVTEEVLASATMHERNGFGSDEKLSYSPPKENNRPQTAGQYVQVALPLQPQSPLTNVCWRHDFDDFVVGPANAMAVAAAHDICEQKDFIETLFVTASSGLGKTHLIHAIGQNVAKKGTRTRVGYLTAEDFTSHFVRASRNSQMDTFKSSLRDLDILLLEDVHLFQGKEKTQIEALATIKSLQCKGKKVVLTSSFSPKELQKVDSQLVSHFCSGVFASIDKPSHEMCREIVLHKAQKQGVHLPNNVVDVLVEHLHEDVRQLESCLKTLIYKSKHLGRSLSIELALDILAQFMPMSSLLCMEQIIAHVCASFKLDEKQLTSRNRSKNYVLARDTVYYLARKHTNSTLAEIGKRLNRRHSTVVKGISAIERQLHSQSTTGRQVAKTLRLVEQNAGIRMA